VVWSKSEPLSTGLKQLTEDNKAGVECQRPLTNDDDDDDDNDD